MTPYYDHAGITIYHGDCREILPLDCDAVLTDPPYGIRHVSAHGASWEGSEIAGDGDTSLRDFVWMLYTNKPRAMFGISWKQPPPPDIRIALIWDKGPAFGAGDLRLPWKLSWEELYIAGEGWRGFRDEGVLRGPCVVSWESKGRVHPHQKPEWLFIHLMQKLPDAQIILDPFMGSGSTLVAASRCQKRAIGIELEERYCAIAVERLRQEVLPFTQPDLPFAAEFPPLLEIG